MRVTCSSRLDLRSLVATPVALVHTSLLVQVPTATLHSLECSYHFVPFPWTGQLYAFYSG